MIKLENLYLIHIILIVLLLLHIGDGRYAFSKATASKNLYSFSQIKIVCF